MSAVDALGARPGAGVTAGVVETIQPTHLSAATGSAEPFDPIAVYWAAVEAGLEAVLWLRASEDLAMVGIGHAWSVEAEGESRFASANAAWQAVADSLGPDDPSLPRGVGPVALGALGFTGRRPPAGDVWEPFGAASLVLPEVILARTGGGSWITTMTPRAREADARRAHERLLARARELTPGPGGLVARPVVQRMSIVDQQPDETSWRRTVGLFAGAVGRGRLDKVVLARRVVLASPADLDVENALRRLAAAAPESTVFAFRRAGRTFLGATPERLIRTDGREFRTVAIAGSTGRGADPAGDAQLAAALLASEKEREEHDVVVAALRDRLGPISGRLEIAAEPRVLTLRHVQHLITEIEGTVHEREGLLALAERLHPTPAVGGEPRDLALALIDEYEGFERGWYAGPIGWLGPDGDGELMVALRSGVVDRTQATLFAGCGIVADSDPDREWEESRMKLKAVASALGRPGDEP
jgi:isochorismate synthase